MFELKNPIFLLRLSAFFLPFFQTGSIVCWVLILVMHTLGKEGRSLLVQSGLHSVSFWLMPAYFLMHIAGMLWTENQIFGWKDIETKLSFILLPFVIASVSVDSHSTRTICRAFINGALVAVVYLFIRALGMFITDGDPVHFFYANITSALMHPTYLGMYLSFAMLLTIFYLHDRTGSFLQYRELVIFTFFSVMLFLTESRAAILSTLLLIPVFVILLYIKRRLSIKQLLFILTTLLALVMFNQFGNPMHNRFAEITGSQGQVTVRNASGSVGSRIEIWKQAKELVVQSPVIGHGTGDAKDILLESYRKSGFNYALDKKLNAHNQFIQSGIALGFIGFLLLITMLIRPLFPFQTSPFTYLLFMLILNAMTESIFETQKGVLFSAFFYSLFMTESLTSGSFSATEKDI